MLSEYMLVCWARSLGFTSGVPSRGGRTSASWRGSLGEINYYVHDKFDVPLIVTDDDISGTFTFVRALAD